MGAETLVEVSDVRLEGMELVFKVRNMSDMDLRIHTAGFYKKLPKPSVKKYLFGLLRSVSDYERIGLRIPIPYDWIPAGGERLIRIPLKYVPQGRCVIKLAGYFIAGELQYAGHPLISKTVERRFEKIHEFTIRA